MANTVITGPILDSFGQPANGFLYGAQTARSVIGGALVTQTVVKGRVIDGEPFLDDGVTPLEVPATAVDAEAFQWVEDFRPFTKQVVRYTDIPDAGPVAYSALIERAQPVGSSTWIVPGWARELVDANAGIAASVAHVDEVKTEIDAAAESVADDVASISKGTPNGVAGLDSGARVPQGQLPAHLTPTALEATNRTLVSGDITNPASAIGAAASSMIPVSRKAQATRSIVSIRTGTNSLTNGKPVGLWSRKRRQLILRNIGNVAVQIGKAAGRVVTPPSYTDSLAVGDEYVAGWDPNPFWIKSGVIGNCTYTSGSTSMTVNSMVFGTFAVGQTLAAQAGIPSGTTITAIAGSTLTLSKTTTAAGTAVSVAAVATVEVETAVEV